MSDEPMGAFTTMAKAAEVGFGCWAAGGVGWGKVDDLETVAAMHKAVELGMTVFDTADLYGKGHAESLIGQHLGGVRDRLFIATKGGLDWGQFGDRTPVSDRPQYGMGGRRIEGFSRNSHPDYLAAAINASLERLGTSWVDMYFIHWPDPGIPISETARFMLEMQRSGKVRYLGVSNFSVQQLEEWLTVAPLDAVQLPYSMLWRDIEADLLPFCVAEHIPVMAYGPMAHGLLTGKLTPETRFSEDDFRRGHPLFVGKTFDKNLEIVEELKRLATSAGVSPGQFALAWVLSQPGIKIALAGAKSPKQVEQNALAAGMRLDEKEQRAVSEILNAERTGA